METVSSPTSLSSEWNDSDVTVHETVIDDDEGDFNDTDEFYLTDDSISKDEKLVYRPNMVFLTIFTCVLGVFIIYLCVLTFTRHGYAAWKKQEHVKIIDVGATQENEIFKLEDEVTEQEIDIEKESIKSS